MFGQEREMVSLNLEKSGETNQVYASYSRALSTQYLPSIAMHRETNG